MSLSCKKLTDIGERFELKRISSRIEEEHRSLFAHLTLEPNIGFNHKVNPGSSQPIRKRLPIVHRQHDAEVRNWNIVAIHRIVVRLLRRTRLQMRNNLVAEEIEIDPLRRTSSLCTSQRASVKSTSSIEIIDRKRDMKGGKCHMALLTLIIRRRFRRAVAIS